MKKNVKEFIKKIEVETSIRFNPEVSEPTYFFYGALNQPLISDTIGIDNGSLLVMIISCGCKKCKEIVNIEIFYGLGGNGSMEAEDVKTQINTIAPKIPITLNNLLDLNSMFPKKL